MNEFRADEEPVDQKRFFEDSCKPKCVRPLIEYQVYELFIITFTFVKFIMIWFIQRKIWSENYKCIWKEEVVRTFNKTNEGLGAFPSGSRPNLVSHNFQIGDELVALL